jgi:hypothetical protein
MKYKKIIKEYEFLKKDVYRITDIVVNEIKKVLPETEIFEFNKCIKPEFGRQGVTFTSFLAEYDHMGGDASFITWVAFIPESYFCLSPKNLRKKVLEDLEGKNYGWLFTPAIDMGTDGD